MTRARPTTTRKGNLADSPTRFLEKVQVTPDNCWIWMGRLNTCGYGQMKVGSRSDGSRRNGLSHRVAYELFIGPIQDGLCVLHRCDNPACVYPGHLWLGSQRENIADMVQKGRQVGRRRRGERHHNAKLNAADVFEVRQRWAGGETKTSIARALGVARSTIGRVVRMNTWTHIPEEGSVNAVTSRQR